MNRLRLGFLGFGFIGKVHAYGHRTLPFYYPGLPASDLVAVCTGRPESAAAARDGFAFTRIESDPIALCTAPDIDAIHIATPNALHLPALRAAMAAGKHIYCEKPMVASLSEAREVASLLPGYRGTAQMVLQNRFAPATMKAKALIDAGFLGKRLSFRAAYLHSGSVDPAVPLKWKLNREWAGGGVLFDLGSHIIDLMRHLLGEIAEVDCRTAVAWPQRQALDGGGSVAVTAEDLALVTARLADGCLGTIEASKIAAGALDELRFEIHGADGALRFNLMQPNHLEVFECAGARHGKGWQKLDTTGTYPAPAAAFPPPAMGMGWLRLHVACLASFVQAVAEGRPAEPSLATGVRLHEIMEACYRSAAERRPVTC
jgi:predicted dehydrogenase